MFFKLHIFTILCATVVVATTSGIIGYFYAQRLDETQENNARIRLAMTISEDIKKVFGVIKPDDPLYPHITQGIHLYKDMSLAVVEQDGIKTVRLYE